MSKETKSDALRRLAKVVRSPIGGFQPSFIHELLNGSADELDKKAKSS